MRKNIDVSEWAICELQELANRDGRPLKRQMEKILERAAEAHFNSKKRLAKKKGGGKK